MARVTGADRWTAMTAYMTALARRELRASREAQCEGLAEAIAQAREEGFEEGIDEAGRLAAGLFQALGEKARNADFEAGRQEGLREAARLARYERAAAWIQRHWPSIEATASGVCVWRLENGQGSETRFEAPTFLEAVEKAMDEETTQTQ